VLLNKGLLLQAFFMGRMDAAHKPTWTYLRRVSAKAIMSLVEPAAIHDV